MTFINIPVEWFSIGFDWTWMLLFGDIRQGIFYAMLLSFWIIFCGEHMMVGTTEAKVVSSPTINFLVHTECWKQCCGDLLWVRGLHGTLLFVFSPPPHLSTL